MFISCIQKDSKNLNQNKKYYYIEVSGDRVFGINSTQIDTVEILAQNDSLAYIEVFQNICISRKAKATVAQKIKELTNNNVDYSSIKEFRLLNEKFEEIKQDVVTIDVLIEIQEIIDSIKVKQITPSQKVDSFYHHITIIQRILTIYQNNNILLSSV